MMIQARKKQMKVSEAILHFEISGPENLNLRWEIPDQSYLNKQQQQGFWAVASH